MSEPKSGMPTSEELDLTEEVYKKIMALIDQNAPPHIYIAAMCVALGKIVGRSSILPEEVENRVYKPIQKAFEVTRETVLAMPEARARLEARYARSNSDTIH